MKQITLTVQEFFNFKQLVKSRNYQAKVSHGNVCITCQENILKTLGYL